MKDLQQHYLEGLPSRIDALSSALKVLKDNPRDTEESIRRIAHSLRGSGATYGFPKITEISGRLEDCKTKDMPEILDEFIRYLRNLVESEMLEKQNILLMEDNQEDALLTQTILGDHLFNIHLAETGSQAEEILKENEIGLIILDLILPDTDGRNFIMKLKEDTYTAHIPIIVLSVKHHPHIKTECFALGADEFFEKPVDPDLLSAAVSSKLQKAKQLFREYRIDSLTGLLNRASFNESFQRLKALSLREKSPLAIAFVDLDHFKAINDTHGHQVGDEVLKHVADIISISLRKSDIIARWGGEEFVMLLYNSDSRGSKIALEKMLQTLADTPYITDNGVVIQCSFSGGITTVEEGDSINSVVSRADTLLYFAKDAGRNRIAIETDLTGEMRKTILLAEDDDLTADFILHRLRKEGFDVHHFVNGEEALEAFQKIPVSLAILDVKMPGMDGFEVLKRLREIPKFKSMPIMMLTSMGVEKDIVRGLELGADDYMLKPFSPTELLARVRRLLR